MEDEKPFDASDAHEADPRDVAALVASRGYTDFYLPFILGLARRWYKELANPSLERKNKMPDDALRGGIRVLEALIALPDDILREANRRNQEEKDAEAVDQHYERRVIDPDEPYDGLSPSDPI